MAGHYIRDEITSAPHARGAARFALLLLPVSLLFHRLGAIPWDALLMLFAISLALAALAALVAAGGLAKAWTVGAKGGAMALSALVVACLALAPFAAAGALALRNPAVSVATTDAFQPSPPAPAEAAATPAGPPSPAVTSGRRYEAPAPQVYDAARLVFAANGWEIGEVVAGDPEPVLTLAGPDDLGRSTGIIPIPTPRSAIDMAIAADPLERADADRYLVQAVARDFLFARRSDVTIRIEAANGTTRVDLRSASREGTFDLGQNRRFIEDFLLALDAEMTGGEAVGSDA